MFFENENFSAQLFTVDEFPCANQSCHVKPRPFGALALRTQGSARFRFGDGTCFASNEGSVIYIPPGIAYDADYDNSVVFAFHFWDTSVENTAECYVPRSPEIPHLFKRACEIYRVGTPTSRMEVTSIFYKIIALLGTENAPGAQDHSAFMRAVDILTEEYRDPELSLRDVCRRASISESAFRRNFVAHYGKPPIKFLTELRLGNAQKLLISTPDTVEQIALASGFHDVKYFSRVVKEHFGCTPSELRFV